MTSLIDVVMPVVALFFSMHTAVIGPVPVTPEVKRIWNGAAYDGDTLQLRHEAGFIRIIFTVRVLELDTAEISGKCPEEKTKAYQAKDVTNAFIQSGPVFLTKVEPSLEQYGRMLVSVGVQQEDGTMRDLADRLKSDPRQIARGYDKDEGRQPWCPRK